MRQSTVIFGVMIFAFVVYITMRGQLPDYLALFSSGKSSTASTNSAASNSEKSKGTSILDETQSFLKDYGIQLPRLGI